MKMKLNLYLILLILVYSSCYLAQESNTETKKSKTKTSNSELLDNYLEKRGSSISKYSKEIKLEDQKELDSIVNQLKNEAPNSYEYNYVEVLNQNYAPNTFSNLEKAAEISPNNVELYESYITYYELTNNPVKKKQYCQKLYDSNVFSEGILEYNYNLLNSLENNSILFTYGGNDTYPAIIQQEVKNVRKDVKILNIEFLKNLDYRTASYDKLALKKPTCSIDDLFEKTIEENPNSNIYLSITINPKLLSNLSNNLYITGLAFKYSTTDFNNIESLVNNWEYKFKSDELSKPTENLTLNRINLNYSLPLIILYKYYDSKGKNEKKKEIEKIILKIAKEGNQEDLINKHIGNK
jgi:hypothetical protein